MKTKNSKSNKLSWWHYLILLGFGVLFLIIGTVLLVTLTNYFSNERAKRNDFESGYQLVKNECEEKRVSSKNYSPEAAFDLYYDNGPTLVPVCRQPNSQDEVNKVIEHRQHQHELESGEEETPTSDEECYSVNVCN